MKNKVRVGRPVEVRFDQLYRLTVPTSTSVGTVGYGFLQCLSPPSSSALEWRINVWLPQSISELRDRARAPGAWLLRTMLLLHP